MYSNVAAYRNIGSARGDDTGKNIFFEEIGDPGNKYEIYWKTI